MKFSKLMHIIIYIILFYIWASLLEWIIHKYIMHGEVITKSHIKHHISVKLNQHLQNTVNPYGLVFRIENQFILFIINCIAALLLWKLIGLDTWVPWYIIIIAMLISTQLYFWAWNSMHTAYHMHDIKINSYITDSKGDNIIIYGLLPHFNPNRNSAIYKFMKKYHAIHHMNKGKSKGNYNIVVPLADYILGTHTPIIDNRKHFSDPKNIPKTQQEKWLAEHPVFELQIGDNDTVLYRETGKKWEIMPSYF